MSSQSKIRLTVPLIEDEEPRTVASRLIELNLPIRRVRVRPPTPTLNEQPSDKSKKDKKDEPPLQVEISEGFPEDLAPVAYVPMDPNAPPVVRGQADEEMRDAPNPRPQQMPATQHTEPTPEEQGLLNLDTPYFRNWAATGYQPPEPPGQDPNTINLGAEQFVNRIKPAGVDFGYDPECKCARTVGGAPPPSGNGGLASTSAQAAAGPAQPVMPAWDDPRKAEIIAKLGRLKVGDNGYEKFLDPRLAKVAMMQEMAPMLIELKDRDEEDRRFMRYLDKGVDPKKIFNIIVNPDTYYPATDRLAREFPTFKNGMTPDNYEIFVADVKRRRPDILRVAAATGAGVPEGAQLPITIPEESEQSPRFGVLMSGEPIADFDAVLEEEWDRVWRIADRYLEPSTAPAPQPAPTVTQQEPAAPAYATGFPAPAQPGMNPLVYIAQSAENLRVSNARTAWAAAQTAPQKRKVRFTSPMLVDDPEDEAGESSQQAASASDTLYITYERPSDASHLTEAKLANEPMQCFRVPLRAFRALTKALTLVFVVDPKLREYNLLRPDSKRRYIKRLRANLLEHLPRVVIGDFDRSSHRERNAWMIYVHSLTFKANSRPQDTEAAAAAGVLDLPPLPPQPDIDTSADKGKGKARQD
ncbi:hypothetical protein ABW21_db0207351 [Orbilia brochopaga]|nr:hypothetical protein ABW21_db0207351 [Drechslerella brochopaga]